jgi:hypothetical protein
VGDATSLAAALSSATTAERRRGAYARGGSKITAATQKRAAKKPEV